MRLSIEMTGEEKAVLDLQRFTDRTADLAPALHGVADLMRAQEAARFDAEGPGWPPLADSTLAYKEGDKILVDTGRMLHSFTEPGAENVEVVTSDSLVFGSGVPYAGFHQTGTSQMPQRKVMDFGEVERREHVKILQRYLVEGEAGAIPYRIAIGI